MRGSAGLVQQRAPPPHAVPLRLAANARAPPVCARQCGEACKTVERLEARRAARLEQAAGALGGRALGWREPGSQMNGAGGLGCTTQPGRRRRCACCGRGRLQRLPPKLRGQGGEEGQIGPLLHYSSTCSSPPKTPACMPGCAASPPGRSCKPACAWNPQGWPLVLPEPVLPARQYCSRLTGIQVHMQGIGLLLPMPALQGHALRGAMSAAWPRRAEGPDGRRVAPRGFKASPGEWCPGQG